MRGDVLVDAGAVIQTDPAPTNGVSLKGDTVTALLGSIIAPGGSISVSGAKNSTLLFATGLSGALPTVDLGPESDLDASGTTIATQNALGYRVGSVLPGGSISVVGNIVAEAGSVLDVSGWSDSKDPAGLLYFPSAMVQGLTTSSEYLAGAPFSPATVDSNGGTHHPDGRPGVVHGRHAGGCSRGADYAQGGSVAVSSGRFYSQNNTTVSPLDVGLVVTQDGPTIPATSSRETGTGVIGTPVNPAVVEEGHFVADDLTKRSVRSEDGATTFNQGGFDSVTLGGSATALEFDGSVSIAQPIGRSSSGERRRDLDRGHGLRSQPDGIGACSLRLDRRRIRAAHAAMDQRHSRGAAGLWDGKTRGHGH